MSTAAISGVILLALSGVYLGFAAEQIETGYDEAVEMESAPEPAAFEEYVDKPPDLPGVLANWGLNTRNILREDYNKYDTYHPPVRRPVVTRKTPAFMGTLTPKGPPASKMQPIVTWLVACPTQAYLNHRIGLRPPIQRCSLKAKDHRL